MARQTDTRDQIISRAGDLLMQRGYHGFSYRDIASHLGVKNAAVHYHFPSKADLALALVEEYQRLLRDRTSQFMAYGGSAREQIENLFAFTEHQCERGRCICPFGAFSVDYEDLPEPVRERTLKFLEDSRRWVAKALELGREQGEFEFEGDARARALSILSALQGARQLVRIQGPEALDDVIADIRTGLGIEP